MIGEPLPELDAVAKAGLTGSAFTLQLTGDTTQGISDMLESMTQLGLHLRDTPSPADPAMPLDPARLSVRFTPNVTRITEFVPKVGTSADCALNAGEGWYFDDPVRPTQIVLCPDTCERTALRLHGHHALHTTRS